MQEGSKRKGCNDLMRKLLCNATSVWLRERDTHVDTAKLTEALQCLELEPHTLTRSLTPELGTLLDRNAQLLLGQQLCLPRSAKSPNSHREGLGFGASNISKLQLGWFSTHGHSLLT